VPGIGLSIRAVYVGCNVGCYVGCNVGCYVGVYVGYRHSLKEPISTGRYRAEEPLYIGTSHYRIRESITEIQQPGRRLILT
jgi:hypothetical protein